MTRDEFFRARLKVTKCPARNALGSKLSQTIKHAKQASGGGSGLKMRLGRLMSKTQPSENPVMSLDLNRNFRGVKE